MWLRKNNIFFYAIPNGGSRNYYEAVAMKKAGLLSGVPDLCIPIPIPSQGKHSLYIELKRKVGGVVSENQKTVIGRLNELGNHAVVCCGFEEAKKVVEDYLDGVPRRTLRTDNEQSCTSDVV
jgi:hypothetical protein